MALPFMSQTEKKAPTNPVFFFNLLYLPTKFG